ncbi:MAG: hypothetical protein ACI8TP_002631 [Acidimicrobiales bacterium]|jgi:hypothetical protein
MILTVVAIATVGAAPASAAVDYTACPAITDSVHRLYSAYFKRPPDDAGFAFWTSEWGTGARSLGQISDGFVGAPEFEQTYGGVSNEQFVDLVYQNVLANELVSDPDYNGVDWPQEKSVTTTVDHLFRKTSVELRVSKAPLNLQWATIIYPPHIQSSPFG